MKSVPDSDGFIAGEHSLYKKSIFDPSVIVGGVGVPIVAKAGYAFGQT